MSVLDKFIPLTPLLDTSIARSKMNLVNRSLLARRKSTGPKNSNTLSSTSTQGDTLPWGVMYQRAVKRVGGSADLKDQLRSHSVSSYGSSSSLHSGI